MYGYGGKILRVNLTDGSIRTEATPADLARHYLGGRGFGAYFTFHEIPAGADPLGADNRLIVSAGPTSGLLIPGAGKLDISCKSPLTGGYAGSNVGGMFSAEMKYAGFDSIIVTGAAAQPVYLYLANDRVEIRPARELWGCGCFDTEAALKKSLGEEFQTLVIGPAGENLVKYACIGSDYGRQAGRGGVGAVMGSKRLKAIAVRGDRSVPVADLGAYREQSKAMFAACKASPALGAWQRYGTSGVTTWANEIAAFPTRHFRGGFLEEHATLSGEVMREKIVVTDKGCCGCPSPCGKWSHVRRYGVRVEGPEYETTALLGGDCALTDIEDVAYANYLCDDLGLDTISAGATVAFAMECFEKGILTEKDTGGVKLEFGNPRALFTLLERIARREGLGDTLAEGVRRSTQVFGERSNDFAVEVKGMEQSGYETHRAPSMLLAYMTCDVGAHHNRAWAITYDLKVGRDLVTADKAAAVISLQHIRPLMDALGCCRLQWVELSLDLRHYAPILAAITGLDRSWEDLLQISERIWNLTRLYWFRAVEGFGREADYPPKRFTTEPAVGGATAGKLTAWDDAMRLLDWYYEQRGWDTNGRPMPAKLRDLGL